MGRKTIATAVASVALVAATAVAEANTEVVRDDRRESKQLKRNPNLDIVRGSVAHGRGSTLVYKAKMRGRLKPGKANTRPFVLINTNGGKRTKPEYLVVGKRVLKSLKGGKRFRRVGSNRFTTRKRTWVYRFDAKSFGNPRRYGWAILTSRGKATDIAPKGRYKRHKLR